MTTEQLHGITSWGDWRGSKMHFGISSAPWHLKHMGAVQGHYAVTQRQAFCQGVRHLVVQAQQSPGDERLHSKYLQVTALLNLRYVDPSR